MNDEPINNDQGNDLKDSSESMNKFMKIAFDDLVDIAVDNQKLFEELYYNRKNQCDEFYTQMADSQITGQNILIVGNAGIGKTSFMHKIKFNCNRNKFYTIMIDYRTIIPRNANGVVEYFIGKIQDYFLDIGKPIHTIKNGNSLDQNFQAVHTHLEKLDGFERKKHLILFLDDFDYAEDEWYKLLKYFLPFSNSSKVSLVLSVRKPLLNAIDEYDDRFRNSYIRKAYQINLHPISIENVISMRLAPLLVKEKAPEKLYGLVQNLFTRKSELCKLAHKYGTIVEGLPRFEYPLSIKYNSFIQEITSGDLRESFDIAYESLAYIINNYSVLKTFKDKGSIRKIIGREGVMRILYDNEHSSYKIINLHKVRSKKGNSLFFNVLEAIKLHGVADDRFYGALSMLGHNKRKVDLAIQELSSKKHKFFHHKKFIPKHSKNLIVYDLEFEFNKKLEMYLAMAKTWNEYISRCGNFGESVEKYI